MVWLKITFAVALIAVANANVFAQDDITVIPQTAGFSIENLEPTELELVGSLGIRRFFQGTRAQPQYRDMLEFFSFDGKQLKFAKFSDPEIKERFLEKLAGGYRIPVVITATIESRRAGHDGINVAMRKIPTITKCEPTTVEAIGFAAKAAEIEQSAINDFELSLEPDAVSNDIAISVGRVYAKSKTARQASKVSVSYLKVFNPTAEPAKVEIKNLTVVQDGVTQTAKVEGVNAWEIEPQSWADGIYTSGKTPKRIWGFVPDEPVDTKLEATITINLLINGEPVSIEKTHTPK